MKITYLALVPAIMAFCADGTLQNDHLIVSGLISADAIR